MGSHAIWFSNEEEKEFQSFKGTHKIKSDAEGIRRFFFEKGMKEAEKEVEVQSESKAIDNIADLLISQEAPQCPYHAYDPLTKKSYCDTKEIPLAVCIRRHGRYSHFDRTCKPPHLKKKPLRPTFERPLERRTDATNTPYNRGREGFKCPEGNSKSFCMTERCSRRPQCREEGIIPKRV